MTAKQADPNAPVPQVIRSSRVALANQLETLALAPGRFFAAQIAGSPMKTDTLASNTAPAKYREYRRQLHAQTLHLSRLVTANVHDHVESLLQIISGGSLPLFSHFSLARPAQEAAAYVAYLLDPAIDFEQRILRGAALLFGDARSDKSVVETFDPRLQKAIGSRPDDRIDRLRKQIGDAGIAFINQESSLQLGQQTARMSLRMTDLVDATFPRRTSAYRIGSGSIHSLPGTLASKVTTMSPEEVMFTADVGDIGTAAMLCLEAVGVVIAAFAAYYGHDGEAEARATRTRVGVIDRLVQEHYQRLWS